MTATSRWARWGALAGSALWVGLAVLAIASCSGCSGGSGGGAPSGGDPPLAAPSLSQFGSCDELRAAIVEDAKAKVAVQAGHLRQVGWMAVHDGDVLVGAPGEPAPAPRPDEGGPQPGRSTDTNVQVPGVDEADVVETDGSHVYALHGSELVVLAAWPPEASAIAARVAIEGTPAGMFVVGTRAAILSSVYDPGDLGGDDACAWIDDPLPRPLAGSADAGIAFCPPQFTKITLVDLAGDAPRVAREVYLEGGYAAARRHGDFVRVVVTRGWGLPPGVPEPWNFISTPAAPGSEEELLQRVDAWKAAATAALEASALDDWLPAHRERVAGELVDVPLDCSAAHVPPPGLSEHGATRIVGLDMTEDSGDVAESLVMGGAQQVYASADALLLAYPDWSWADAGEPSDRTAIHAFAIGSGSADTSYLASGFVPGTTLSQLAFDERDGIVRVASTVSSRDGSTPTINRITTARIDGGSIAIVGSTGDLAPGERVHTSRYVGDLAYLVTFRQVDPLFVIDLADPAAPRVLGEVELPGFSEYIHPLEGGHLLTVGRDVGGDGRVRGVAVRIFDVSDPAAPRLAHERLLPGDGWTPASSNHLAFTYDPRLAVLALPYTRYDEQARSSLVLLGVDPAAGLSPLGDVDHGRFASDPCAPPGGGPAPAGSPSCPALPDMQRGLFIEDYVYSISSGGVLVNALADLATPVAAVELPAPATSPPVF